jgi:hypothetical protein
MSRRCIRLRIDPRIDMPWLRAGFKHPLITEWARENRSALVHAALTVVQAWIAAGKPLNARRLGSFESWSGIMGGVLEVTGIPGFLGNLNELYQAADTDGQMWREFTGSWWEAYREEPKKAGELNQFCEERDLMVSVRGDGSARSQQTRLGKALAAKRDRVFNGLTVKQSSHHNHKTGVLYALALADGGDNPGGPGSRSTSLLDLFGGDIRGDVVGTFGEQCYHHLSPIESIGYGDGGDVGNIGDISWNSRAQENRVCLEEIEGERENNNSGWPESATNVPNVTTASATDTKQETSLVVTLPANVPATSPPGPHIRRGELVPARAVTAPVTVGEKPP